MRRFIGLLLLPMALLLIIPVHATTPTMITGRVLTSAATTTESRMAGGNLLLSVTGDFAFMGGIQGGGTATINAIINSTGNFVERGRVSFSGTVGASQTGTAEVAFTATGVIIAGGSVQSAQGQLVIGGGAEGLANLHGQGTIQVMNGLPATYSVLVHFDPA